MSSKVNLAILDEEIGIIESNSQVYIPESDHTRELIETLRLVVDSCKTRLGSDIAPRELYGSEILPADLRALSLTQLNLLIKHINQGWIEDLRVELANDLEDHANYETLIYGNGVDRAKLISAERSRTREQLAETGKAMSMTGPVNDAMVDKLVEIGLDPELREQAVSESEERLALYENFIKMCREVIAELGSNEYPEEGKHQQGE